MGVDRSRLVPVEEMTGEDLEETEWLRKAYSEARQYIARKKWCQGVRKAFLGLGAGGVVAVFLVDIDASGDVDRTLWLVVGDLPTAYLVIDEAPTASAALEGYCELMEDWVKAVRGGCGLEGVFPVAAEATAKNADSLERRIKLLREELIPRS